MSYNVLRIDSDPTTWTLYPPIEPGQVPTSDEPVVLPVCHPLVGRLVLSPRSVASAVFLDFVSAVIWNGLVIPEPSIYVASAAGASVQSVPGTFYVLPAGTDLAALEAEIIRAMTSQHFLTVDVADGALVINGAVAPFAVLCPSQTGPRAP
jgi:hypothetical protein